MDSQSALTLDTSIVICVDRIKRNLHRCFNRYNEREHQGLNVLKSSTLQLVKLDVKIAVMS